MRFNCLILWLVLILMAGCRWFTVSPLSAPIIVLTFDDQHASVYENALPVLQQYNWRGTLFVNSGAVGLAGKMTWAQIEEMEHIHGWETGGHTLMHENLGNLSYEEAEQNIRQDWQHLRDRNLRAESFALPRGNMPLEFYPILRRYYENVRGSLDLAMYQPLDRWHLGYFSHRSGWSARTVTDRIQRGIYNGESIIIIGFHRLENNDEGHVMNCPPEIFAAIISWIHQRGLRVLPLAEGVEELVIQR